MKPARKPTTRRSKKSVCAPSATAAPPRRLRRTVSLSADPVLLERIERHAAECGLNFSAAASQLIVIGLGASAELSCESSTDLLAVILGRLEEISGEAPFIMGGNIWRTKCPIDATHDLFLTAYADETHSLDWGALDFLDREHTPQELLVALGFRLALDPAQLLGRVAGVDLRKSDLDRDLAAEQERVLSLLTALRKTGDSLERALERDEKDPRP